MAKPTKILYTASLETIFDEFSYTLGRLKANKSTQKLAEDFNSLRAEFWVILEKEFGFREQLQAAFAQTGASDDRLNEVADTVIKTILSLAKNGFQDTLYKHYCGEKRPYQFKEPILGEQLEGMRPWATSMRNEAAAPALQQLAEPVEQAVAEADQAVSARDKVQREISDFRTFGQRKLFIDAFNQRRERLAQDLDALELDSSERFFRRSRAKSQTETQADQNTLRKEITTLEQELNEKRALLLALEAQEEEQKKADQELEASLAALAESQRLAEEAQRRVAELKAKYAKR